MARRVVDGPILDLEFVLQYPAQQISIHILAYERREFVVGVAEFLRVAGNRDPVRVSKALAIPFDHLVAMRDALFEMGELVQAQSRMDLAHAPVTSHLDELLPATALAVVAYQPCVIRQLPVLGGDHPPDAGSHDLGRVERETRGICQASSS